jgi:hypothetical protein
VSVIDGRRGDNLRVSMMSFSGAGTSSSVIAGASNRTSSPGPSAIVYPPSSTSTLVNSSANMRAASSRMRRTSRSDTSG